MPVLHAKPLPVDKFVLQFLNFTKISSSRNFLIVPEIKKKKTTTTKNIVT